MPLSCCLNAGQARAPGGGNWGRGIWRNLTQRALKIQGWCHSLREVGMAGVKRRNGVICSQSSSDLEGTEKGQGLEQKLL